MEIEKENIVQNMYYFGGHLSGRGGRVHLHNAKNFLKFLSH